MDEQEFQATKSKLDAELDAIPPDAQVGIKMGWDLYTEFHSKDLLEPKEADMILVKWTLPSYRGKFVSDIFEDDIPDDGYQVGRP